MASVNHSFLSAKSEQTDATLIGPNEWNANHVSSGAVNAVIVTDGSGNLTYDNTFTYASGSATITGTATSSTVTAQVASVSSTVTCQAVSASSNVTCAAVNATGGLGYPGGLGIGGTVTQLTNKGTAVTINKLTGQITTSNASLSVNTLVTFIVNNTTVKANDTVIVNITSGATQLYIIQVGAIVANTSFTISLYNVTGTASDTLVIQYTIVRGATT